MNNHQQEELIPVEQYVRLQQEFADKEQKIEERLWLDATISQFDNVLRLNYDKSTADFSKIVLDYAAELTKAYVGIFYTLNLDTNIIHATAGYACVVDKLSQQTFEIGEGVVGQAIESKKLLFFEDLPAKNIEIKSSTLNIGAASILVIPLVFNEKAFGVIELVFLRNLEPKFLQLLEIVSRNVAAMLESITNNELTKHLLKRSQEQSEALLAQEEELRQNMEELQATQEGMQKMLDEIKDKESYMNSLIDASKDTILTIDRDYQLVYSNAALRKSVEGLGYHIDKGFDTLSFYTEEQKPTFIAYYERAFAGETFEVLEEFASELGKMYVSITYSPIYDKMNNVVGVAIFGKDMTQIVSTNKQVEILLDESREQSKAIKNQEQYITSILDASTISIATIDKNYCLVTYNKAFMDGVNALGIHIHKGDDMLATFGNVGKEYYDKALAGESIDIDVEYAGKYFNTKYNPIRNEQSEIVGASLFSMDITLQIQLQKETEQLLAQSQKQTEELKAQEEELRQNSEELMATQEQMLKKQEELDKTREEEAHRATQIAGIQKKNIEKLAAKLQTALVELKTLKGQSI
jgi:PAS domain-containing protein